MTNVDKIEQQLNAITEARHQINDICKSDPELSRVIELFGPLFNMNIQVVQGITLAARAIIENKKVIHA